MHVLFGVHSSQYIGRHGKFICTTWTLDPTVDVEDMLDIHILSGAHNKNNSVLTCTSGRPQWAECG